MPTRRIFHEKLITNDFTSEIPPYWRVSRTYISKAGDVMGCLRQWWMALLSTYSQASL